MGLIDFINQYDIDLKALERMRKRIFVLGRFNNNPLNDGVAPDLYLFTNRKDLEVEYTRNFKSNRGLDYSSFVEALQPRIAEKQSSVGAFTSAEGVTTNIMSVRLDASNTGDLDSYIINALNYFFVRAISTTEQGEFLKPNLPELIDKMAGKTIYNQIRSNLSVFCSFQPKSIELIDAIARLFAKCKSAVAIPLGYAYGEKLPIGFAQKLIDYLYDEEGPDEFSLDGIDFASSPWGGLVKSEQAEEARNNFSVIVTSFKNELLGRKPQYKLVIYSSGNLSQLTKDAIPVELKNEFQKSKDAFNMLRQIMRSKVLLSMVVEWILADLKDLPDARNEEEDSIDQYKKIEDAVLGKGNSNELADPIRRPSKEERRNFSLSMGESFDKLMQAVLSGEDKKIKSLSPEFQELARKLLEDQEKIESIRKVTNFGDLEKYKAFKGAIEVVFMDLISPRLYKEPGLSFDELKIKLKRQVVSAYLSAMMLSPKAKGEFASIVTDEFLAYFEGKIDGDTQTINDKEEILAKLMENLVEVMTRDEVRKILEEGLRVLDEVFMLKAENEKGGKIKAPLPNPKINIEKEAQKELIELAVQHTQAYVQNGGGTSSQHVEMETSSDSSENDKEKDKVAKSEEASVDSKNGNQSELKTVVDENIQLILEHELKGKKTLDQVNVQGVAEKVVEKIRTERSELFNRFSADLSSYEKIMHVIYERYNDNPEAKTFRNNVEAMSIMKLMVLFKEDLGFGKTFSNLYDLLIDLVANLNSDDPDISPRKFLQENTLTKYFDDALFDNQGRGYSALLEILNAQGKESLKNVVHFVSELRGVKYLMDKVKGDSDAEVIIVNATAAEFMTWVKEENLTPNFNIDGGNFYRLRAGFLTNKESKNLTPPGLIYVTDLAFPESLGSTHGSKMGWLNELDKIEMKRGNLSYVIPPMILSTTSRLSSELNWKKEGEELAIIASKAASPVFIVGPSPKLNEDKAFPTILPAGYLFCVDFLSDKEQRIAISGGAGDKSKGRFKVMGTGSIGYRDSIKEVIWGIEDDTYCFAADYYLFVIVQLLATIKYRGGDLGFDSVGFYKHFFDGTMTRDDWESSVVLNKAIIGESMKNFCLEHIGDTKGKPLVERNPAQPSSLFYHELTNVKVLYKKTWRDYTDIGWFEKVRSALELP